MEKLIPTRLTTLGHPQRLAIFRLLMRRYPDRVAAGEIAGALELKASTLSAYLAALMQAGLVTQDRAGTSLLYTVDMSAVQQTLDYLLLDCCRGRPELCTPFENGTKLVTQSLPEGRFNVLFICSGNSARSIFAECILRDIAGDRFNVFSAGTRPGSQLNPVALQLLVTKGHDVTQLRSKDISEFHREGAPQFDFVFTVCDQAANEDCAAWPGQPITGHWGVPDPVKVQGSVAEKALAFQEAYGALARRIEIFAALDVNALGRLSLQQHIDHIGRIPQRNQS